MRDVPLTAIKGGINRTRIKGGARADDLYDLLNGYVTEAGTVHVRPGSDLEQTLDSLTRGIVSFGGSIHTFCHEVVTVPSGYTLHVLSNPNSVPANIIALSKIHFAKPFLGFLYVVAEFADGLIRHFWLQTGGAWEADRVYFSGDVAEPTVPNGIIYKATRSGSTFPSWAANVSRSIGDRVEPTVYNGYYYEVVDVLGSNPTSGANEPDFPTSEGAQVIEDTQGVPNGSSTNTDEPSNVPSSDIVDRYS